MMVATSTKKRLTYLNSVLLVRCVFVVLCLVLPFVLRNAYYLRVFGFLFINSIVALGLNMAVGVAGQINLGQAGLVGVGAYSFAILLQKGVMWPLAVLSSLAVTSFLGVIFGYVSNRLRGPYLAIITLAFNLVLTIVMNNEITLTGGPFGIRVFTVLNLRTAGAINAGIFIILYYLTTKLYQSHLGRCFRAIRDDEIAARAYGINPIVTKTYACVFSALLAGVGGILQGCTFGFLAPTSFTVTQSFRYLAMIVVGGLGYLPGTIFGVSAITLIPEFLRWLTGLWDIVLGVTIILLLLFFPEGFGYVGKYLSRLFTKVRGEERWTGTIKAELISEVKHSHED